LVQCIYLLHVSFADRPEFRPTKVTKTKLSAVITIIVLHISIMLPRLSGNSAVDDYKLKLDRNILSQDLNAIDKLPRWCWKSFI